MRRARRLTLSSKANHTGGREPFGRTSFSEKLVKGTTQWHSTPSPRRQCGEATLRTFVNPGSLLRPFRAKCELEPRADPFFKTGKEMRERLNR